MSNSTCNHPDHNDAENCEDRAIGCSKHCICCMGDSAVPETAPLIHIDDVDSAKARKLIGLLAMAKGSGASDQEMETALAAAVRLPTGSSSASCPTSSMSRSSSTDLNDPDYKARLDAWLETDNLIPLPDPPSTVIFLGRKSDVAFAQYAYGFLQTAFARAWRTYKNAVAASMAWRASFYTGIYDGLHTKLRRDRQEAEQQLLGAAGMAKETYSLAVITEADQRQSFLKTKHPVLHRSRSAPVNVMNYDTVREGRVAGEKITISKALENTKSKEPKPELT